MSKTITVDDLMEEYGRIAHMRPESPAGWVTINELSAKSGVPRSTIQDHLRLYAAAGGEMRRIAGHVKILELKRFVEWRKTGKVS